MSMASSAENVQESLADALLYARAYATMEITPSSEPAAAFAANSRPCSRNRNIDTGPEVKGKATIQPPAAGPQRRAAKVASAMNAGVIISFNRKSSMAGCTKVLPR